jgi:phosphatidylserine synthase
MQTGEVSLFHPQNNAQYVVEGFLVGLTMLCAACSVLCLIVVAPKFKSQLARDVVAGGCCAAFFVLFVTVLRWYTMKNRWVRFVVFLCKHRGSF